MSAERVSGFLRKMLRKPIPGEVPDQFPPQSGKSIVSELATRIPNERIKIETAEEISKLLPKAKEPTEDSN